jgi:hypothetical protein
MWKKGQSGNLDGRRIRADHDWLPGETKEQRSKRRARERSKAWRQNNPDRLAELTKAGHAKRKENWQEFLAQERERYRKNPERHAEKQRRNPEKVRERNKRSYLKYPHKYVANCAKRRARKLQATPTWVDLNEIETIYAAARQLTIETGVQHEVDHIYPLKGRNFSGLHVPWNLQILTRTENRQKFNKPPID